MLAQAVRSAVAVVAVVALLLATAGCRRDGDRALVSEVGDGEFTVTAGTPLNGRVVAYGAEFIKAEREAVIEWIGPVDVPPGVEHLGSRVVVIEANGTRTGAPELGGACYESWPPPGYGPAVEGRGLRLRPRDRVQVIHYLRGRAPGTWETRGTRIVYRSGGEEAAQEFRGIDAVVKVSDSSTEPPPDSRCGPASPQWLAPSPP